MGAPVQYPPSATANAQIIEQDSSASIAKETGGNLEETAALLKQVVIELRMLRQSFQDWTNQPEPRYDAAQPIIKTFQ